MVSKAFQKKCKTPEADKPVFLAVSSALELEVSHAMSSEV